MLKHLGLCAFALVATQGLAVAGNGTALMKQIPESTQIVLVFDVAEARDSPLIASNFKKLLDNNPDASAKLAAFGIDPMKDIDTLMFAGGGVTELAQMKDVKEMVLIVEGRLPKKAMDSVAVTKTKHRGVEIMAKDDTEAAFIGKNLLFTKAGMMKNAIDVAMGKGKNAATSPKAKPLRTAISSTNTKSDVWMVILVPDKDKATMGQSGLLIDSMSVAIKLSADLAAVVRLNAPNDAEAGKAVSMLNTVLPTLKSSMGGIGLRQAAATLSLSQDKTAVQMSGSITESEIASLISLAGGGPPPPAPKQPAAPVAPKTGGLSGGVKPAPAPAPKP